VVIGFPFAMLFSWFYEWTPQGILRTSEIDRSASVTRQTGKAMDRWIIAVLVLAVVLLPTDRFALRKPAAASADKSIAVPPFENLSTQAGAGQDRGGDRPAESGRRCALTRCHADR